MEFEPLSPNIPSCFSFDAAQRSITAVHPPPSTAAKIPAVPLAPPAPKTSKNGVCAKCSGHPRRIPLQRCNKCQSMFHLKCGIRGKSDDQFLCQACSIAGDRDQPAPTKKKNSLSHSDEFSDAADANDSSYRDAKAKKNSKPPADQNKKPPTAPSPPAPAESADKSPASKRQKKVQPAATPTTATPAANASTTNYKVAALWFDSTVPESAVTAALKARPEKRWIHFGESEVTQRHQTGEIAGVPPGTVFLSKHDLLESGVHCVSESGIHVAQGVVYSVLSNGFNAGPDCGDELAYEFSGKRTKQGEINAHQQIEPGVDNKRDLALINAWLNHTPIRFIRGSKSPLGPENGAFRYEGLFEPFGIEQREVTGEAGKKFNRLFLLLRKVVDEQLEEDDFLSNIVPSPEPPVWQFVPPNYVFRGRMCPTCYNYVPAHSTSHKDKCGKRAPFSAQTYGSLSKEHLLDDDSQLILMEKFINFENASRYLSTLISETEWVYHIFSRGNKEKKLTAFVGDPGTSYSYGGHRRVATGWPPVLEELRNHMLERFGKSSLEWLRSWKPNCALLNFYPSGRHHMNWHQDNEKELGPDPVVVSISLGHKRVFAIRPKVSKGQSRRPNPRSTLHLSLAHGTLLIMGKGMQTHYEHALTIPAKDKTDGDKDDMVGPRVNITFRTVTA